MSIARSCLVALAALSFATPALASGEAIEGAEKPEAVASATPPKVADLKAGDLSDKPAGDGAGLVAAKPAPAAKPEPTLIAKVDLSAQRLTVVVNGQPTHTWPISSGRQGYNTPVGSFTPGWKAKMWYSKQYDDAPMPHSVFFKNGAAIHATQATGMLGRPASHGCVRLSPGNAATFYGLVGKHGLSQTRVVVFGTPKHSAPAIAQRTPPPGAAGVARSAQPRVLAANAQPRYVQMKTTAYAPVYAGGFNNGGSWFGNNGYAYAQPQQVRYVPRGYRPY